MDKKDMDLEQMVGQAKKLISAMDEFNPKMNGTTGAKAFIKLMEDEGLSDIGKTMVTAALVQTGHDGSNKQTHKLIKMLETLETILEVMSPTGQAWFIKTFVTECGEYDKMKEFRPDEDDDFDDELPDDDSDEDEEEDSDKDDNDDEHPQQADGRHIDDEVEKIIKMFQSATAQVHE